MRNGAPLFKDAPVTGTAELSGSSVAVRFATSWNTRFSLGLNRDLLQGTARYGAAISPHDNRILFSRAEGPNPMFGQTSGGLVAALPPAVPLPTRGASSTRTAT